MHQVLPPLPLAEFSITLEPQAALILYDTITKAMAFPAGKQFHQLTEEQRLIHHTLGLIEEQMFDHFTPLQPS